VVIPGFPMLPFHCRSLQTPFPVQKTGPSYSLPFLFEPSLCLRASTLCLAASASLLISRPNTLTPQG
jgi:hypothetical protein